jgi:peroxiredoxin
MALWSTALLGISCGRAPRHPVVEVGELFPAFELPDLQQRIRHSVDYSGMPLLLNFWATWCPPCREEMAGLRILHRQLQFAGGAVVAVSVDDDINLVREFVRKSGIDFPVLLDQGRTFAEGRLLLRTYPTSFMLRPEGRVSEIVIGARNWEVQEQVDAVLSATRSRGSG